MSISRRQFLTGLAGLFAATTFAQASPQKGTTPPAPTVSAEPPAKLPGMEYDIKLLTDSFFPMLRLNEGESFKFYKDSKGIVTVGYGSNVQGNPKRLAGVPVYFQGKPLSAEARKLFIATMKDKTPWMLSQYSITKADAVKMAHADMKKSILHLRRVFSDPKTKQSYFFDLPLCMQALCLDVLYNVGAAKFEKFIKFKGALKNRNFALATRESKVYTDKSKGAVNKGRERRKNRLFRIMCVIDDNPKYTGAQLISAVREDYKKSVPLLTRARCFGIESPCEERMIMGELCHRRLMQMRAQEAAKAKAQKMQQAPVVKPQSVQRVPVPSRGPTR